MTAERTPLYDEHIRLGAQMTNFSGWVMPLQYSSIREEHNAVREAVGLFDLSHMGELRVKDESLAQRLLTRDLSRLRPRRIQYTLFCNDEGGIIDDVLAYAVKDGGYLLVVNAGNQEHDFAWVRSQALKAPSPSGDGARTIPSPSGGGQGGGVYNVSRDWALIGVQGPRAAGLVQRLSDVDLSAVKYYTFVEGSVAGVLCVISRTGYTGEDGFELFCATGDAVKLWRTLLEQGKPDGIRSAGLGARDTLRLEAGMRLYGNDMDEHINPLEAGLAWAVTLDKDFVGRDAIVRARDAGLDKILVGVKMLDRSIPRHGYPVQSEDGRPIGLVTSGNVSFTLGYNIAMAYVPPAMADPGTRLGIAIRGTAAPAEVVPLPFYQRPHPE